MKGRKGGLNNQTMRIALYSTLYWSSDAGPVSTHIQQQRQALSRCTLPLSYEWIAHGLVDSAL